MNFLGVMPRSGFSLMISPNRFYLFGFFNASAGVLAARFTDKPVYRQIVVGFLSLFSQSPYRSNQLSGERIVLITVYLYRTGVLSHLYPSVNIRRPYYNYVAQTASRALSLNYFLA